MADERQSIFIMGMRESGGGRVREWYGDGPVLYRLGGRSPEYGPYHIVDADGVLWLWRPKTRWEWLRELVGLSRREVPVRAEGRP